MCPGSLTGCKSLSRAIAMGEVSYITLGNEQAADVETKPNWPGDEFMDAKAHERGG
jgi:hypothetical protein